MALDQNFEESVQEVDASGDKSCLEKWNSAPEAIADSDRDASGDFECNICLDSLQDPVLTLCGHLYCWPCVYKWLRFHSFSSQNREQERACCPVCKSEISQSSLIPMYGRFETITPSKGNSHSVGTVIPPRPRGPVSAHDLPRSFVTATALHDSRRSYNTTTVPQSASQLHRPHYPYHSQQFNAFDSTHRDFGQMLYARVFGNQLTNMYTSNSYGIVGNHTPRARRHLVQLDKSLSRICFFLFCCIVLCLLLF